MSAPGLFIAAEGGDGAGKSSALEHLAHVLRERGREVVQTREPGGTPEGLHLRALLLGDNGPAWDPRAEHLLMAAARVQHVERIIRPAVERGAVVLCDRYVGSTLAYQGAGRGLDAGFIREVHNRTTDSCWPDITLIFDVDPLVGVARSRRRLEAAGVNEGRFEGLDIDFHNRVRLSYLDQAAMSPSTHVIIDAHLDQDSVAALTKDAVLSRLGERH